MTRILTALCGLALVSGLSVALADGPGGCCEAPAPGCCGNGCGCCQSCQKECVCVPTTKKITKTVYGCKCIDFCIAHNTEFHPCDGCGHCCDQGCGCGCDQGCGCCPTVCPGCEHPRVRKALIKWVRTTECPTFKCEVRCAPCNTCGPACCQGGGCPDAGVMQGEAPLPSEQAPPADAAPKKPPVPPSAAVSRRAVVTR
jgi:hypothetical protein